MAEHGFPPGPLLLTDWGPTDAGWFRSGAAHKLAALERLRHDHPNTSWVLVGDDEQRRDPQIYAAFAAAHPQAVIAVAIRQLTRTQRTLAIGARAASEPGRLQSNRPRRHAFGDRCQQFGLATAQASTTYRTGRQLLRSAIDPSPAG